jgi:hypothetical protein
LASNGPHLTTGDCPSSICRYNSSEIPKLDAASIVEMFRNDRSFLSTAPSFTEVLLAVTRVL